MKVDTNIVSAMAYHFLYALQPGSCTTSLLLGDYEDAYAHAHPHIKSDDMWNDHIRFVEYHVPLCCRNENFKTWVGYKDMVNKDSELKSIMILKYPFGTYVHDWINELDVHE